jgi:thiol-disulfide isomerase/thioredoxin
MSSSVKILNNSDAVTTFRVNNPKSVLYFTASWCPPCKMIAPIYASLAETYPAVAFGKIDIDDNQVREDKSMYVIIKLKFGKAMRTTKHSIIAFYIQLFFIQNIFYFQ